jgi:hypothetical protein
VECRAQLVTLGFGGSVANFADRSGWRMFAGESFSGEHVMIEFKADASSWR